MLGPKRHARVPGCIHTLFQEGTRLFRHRADYPEIEKINTTVFETVGFHSPEVKIHPIDNTNQNTHQL